MAEPISVMICDDLEPLRMILRKTIERHEGFSVISEASNGNDCIEKFHILRPQVVFLDVEMPEKDGLETAKIIMDIAPLTNIVFVTAHDQFMDKAFELYAFDYIVKPFKQERVFETLNRIEMLKETRTVPVPSKKSVSQTRRLMIKNADSISFVDTQDIILIQRENRQSVIYTKDSAFQSSDTLSSFEEKLDPNEFFRSHKSYIINLSYIESITPYGRWTFIVRFKDIKNDALITHERLEDLKNMFS